jgi:hypothetical protein
MAAERMNNNKTNNKSAGERRTKPVHIEFNHATATKISIAGTFNDWRHADGSHWRGPLGQGTGVAAWRLRIPDGGGRQVDAGSTGQ